MKECQEWGVVEALGELLDMKWTIEKRKQGREIWVTSNVEPEAILIGECYQVKEKKRTHYLAAIIVEALNKAEGQDKRNREGWVERIQCALKAEAEAKAQKAIRLGNEVTDEEV